MVSVSRLLGRGCQDSWNTGARPPSEDMPRKVLTPLYAIVSVCSPGVHSTPEDMASAERLQSSDVGNWIS